MPTINERKLDRIQESVDQLLLEDHGGEAAVTVLSQLREYAEDPIGFMRDVLGADPWSRQVEIIEAVRDSPRVVVRSAHTMGKDWIMARLLLWHVFARGGLGIYTGPTDRQLGIGMREIREAFRGAPGLPGELFTRSLRLGGDDRLMAFTSSNVDNLTGWHDPHGVMIAISEGQGERVEDTAYDAAFACTTEPNSKLVVGGNPVRPTGRFFEVSRKANWVAIKIPAAEHPNIAAGRQVVPYGPSWNWPKEIADEYGKDSAYYTSRVLAEFPEEAEDSLILRKWLDAAADRWEAWMDADTGLSLSSASLTFALDVARMGADKTVVAIRQDRILREFVTWGRADLMKTTGRMIREMARWGVSLTGRYEGYQRRLAEVGPVSSRVVVDEIGIGSGPVDRLRELQGEAGGEEWPLAEPYGEASRNPGLYDLTRGSRPQIEGYNGSSSPRGADGHRFSNRRAESHWNLRKLLERGEVALPRDPELFEELLAIQWTTASNGRIQIEDKDRIRARLRRSPDKADAAVMAFDDVGGRHIDPAAFRASTKR